MLIIPLGGKLSWRNPPAVTIGLILINCLVFFTFQSGERARYQQAMAHYFTSGLAKIEVLRYIDHLQTHGQSPPRISDPASTDEASLARYHREMEADIRFLQRLQNDEIIPPADPVYSEWKSLRLIYEDKLSQVTFLTYGFRPAYKKPVTFLTHMFLHGSFSHLLGNMVFLWLLGCMLEMGCGRSPYLLTYLAGGLLAVGLFWLLNWNSTVPLVGASGAISALMGACTILYGKQRINIFLSLGFYFNYMKIPAITLLPIWVGNELFQFFFGGVSQVAYIAHIGGLLGGALLGYLNLKLLKSFNAQALQEDSANTISKLTEEALQRIGALDLSAGRRLLEQALAKDPSNMAVLTHLFNLEKHDPHSPAFHASAQILLNRLSQDRFEHERAYSVYREYIALNNRPRLAPQLYLRLGLIFAALGHLRTARKIVAAFLKKRPEFPGLPTALLKLANAFAAQKMEAECQKLKGLLCTRYPDSKEARLVSSPPPAE